MKIPKLTIILGLMGFLIIVLSIIRWWIIWYDPSQVGFGLMIGFGVIAYGYIYYWMRKVIGDIEEMKHKQEQISKWWIGEELK